MKTIGILQTDEIREELQPQFFNYPSMFKTLLGESFNYNIYDVQNQQYPATLNECEGYLITGSRCGVYENLSWLPPLFDFIRQTHQHKMPLVGVCFGHQAVAQALGGAVSQSQKGWGVSRQTWQITQAAPWMQTGLEGRGSFSLLTMFQDQVDTLPAAAVRIAGSAHCENAAYYIGNHIFCVQGHPEFNGEFMLALLRYREGDISPDAMQTAIATANQPNDSQLCGEWMRRFLNGEF